MLHGPKSTPAKSTSSIGGTEINHRLVAPQALPEPRQRLFKSAEIQQAGAAGAVRPRARLAQIINARPEKLSGHISVVPHRPPRGVLLAVLAAEDDPLRKFFVVVRVARLLIIVADRVQQFRQADGFGHFQVRQRRRHRARAVERLHGGHRAARAQPDQILRGRIAGLIIRRPAPGR